MPSVCPPVRVTNFKRKLNFGAIKAGLWIRISQHFQLLLFFHERLHFCEKDEEHGLPGHSVPQSGANQLVQCM